MTSPQRLHVVTLIEMLQTLDLYQSGFHTSYILGTQAFYSAESTVLSSGLSSLISSDPMV